MPLGRASQLSVESVSLREDALTHATMCLLVEVSAIKGAILFVTGAACGINAYNDAKNLAWWCLDCMQGTHCISNIRMSTKSSLNTRFPITCPSVGEMTPR